MTYCINRDGSVSDVSAHDCKIDRFNATRFSQETEARQKELKRHFALLFAKEGARIIRKMPKWIPAKVKGEAIPVKMELRLYFVDASK
jgi:protein TonB